MNELIKCQYQCHRILRPKTQTKPIQNSQKIKTTKTHTSYNQDTGKTKQHKLFHTGPTIVILFNVGVRGSFFGGLWGSSYLHSATSDCHCDYEVAIQAD